jgi:hypothetical protein
VPPGWTRAGRSAKPGAARRAAPEKPLRKVQAAKPEKPARTSPNAVAEPRVERTKLKAPAKQRAAKPPAALEIPETPAAGDASPGRRRASGRRLAVPAG